MGTARPATIPTAALGAQVSGLCSKRAVGADVGGPDRAPSTAARPTRPTAGMRSPIAAYSFARPARAMAPRAPSGLEEPDHRAVDAQEAEHALCDSLARRERGRGARRSGWPPGPAPRPRAAAGILASRRSFSTTSATWSARPEGGGDRVPRSGGRSGRRRRGSPRRDQRPGPERPPGSPGARARSTRGPAHPAQDAAPASMSAMQMARRSRRARSPSASSAATAPWCAAGGLSSAGTVTQAIGVRLGLEVPGQAGAPGAEEPGSPTRRCARRRGGRRWRRPARHPAHGRDKVPMRQRYNDRRFRRANNGAEGEAVRY